jgi:hypothetical protein
VTYFLQIGSALSFATSHSRVLRSRRDSSILKFRFVHVNTNGLPVVYHMAQSFRSVDLANMDAGRTKWITHRIVHFPFARIVLYIIQPLNNNFSVLRQMSFPYFFQLPCFYPAVEPLRLILSINLVLPISQVD